MRHLVLVRHGESELNAINRHTRVFCGQLETPLTERGREQALAVAQRLVELNYLSLRLAISSPLERARQTLNLILSRLPGGIEVLPASAGLVERSHGLFEGKSEEEVFQTHPAYRDDPNLSCFMDHFHQHAPEGENLATVTERVWQVILGLIASGSGDILVVSHYNPIRCAVGRALKMREDEILRLRVPNAVPIVLRYNGGFELMEWPSAD